MTKILLLSFLLLVVYQFDDLVRALHAFIRRLRRKQYRQLALDSDHYVGTVLAMVGMPLSLNYLLVSDQSLQVKLLIIFALFLTFAVIASGLGMFFRRLPSASQYQSVSAAVGLGYVVAGMFHPVLRTVPWHAGRGRRDLAKLAFLLCLPALLGFGFKYYYGQQGFGQEFDRYLDVLIIVMVGGMFIHLVLSPARRYLSSRHMNGLALVRVAMGLAVTAFLLL